MMNDLNLHLKSLVGWLGFAVVAMVLCLGVRLPSALADDYDEARVTCSATQQAEIDAAIASAKDLLSKVTPQLPPVNSAVGRKFQRWFGGAEGDYHPLPKKIYDGIPNSLSFSFIWCPDNLPLTMPNGGGFAWALSVNEVFFEDAFFNQGNTGCNSKPGIVIHEASHLTTAADGDDFDVDGDGIADYGVANAEQLARIAPEKARRAGDNLEYFVEDMIFGLSPDEC